MKLLSFKKRDAFWAAATVAAFAMGLKLSPRLTEAGTPHASGSAERSAVSSQASGAANSAEAAKAPGGAAASGHWLQSYQKFTLCRDPLERQRLMMAALAGITKANWKEAWHPMFDSRRQGLISEEEWKLFMRQFGGVAGEEVALFGKPADVVNDWETWNIRSAMEGWAARDVNGSWAWISALPEGNYRRGLLAGWMAGAAAVDPDRALVALKGFDPEKDSAIWDVAAGKMSNHDPEKMKSWLTGVSATQGRAGTGWVDGKYDSGTTGTGTAEDFFNRMLQSKMAVNPGDPAYVQTLKDWFDTYSGNPGVPDSAIGRIASALQQSTPPVEVLQWIGSHPASAGTFNASANTVSRWTNANTADEITAWLQANRENPAYDGAAAGFAAGAFPFDPDGARAWAATIKDPAQRESLTRHFETLKSE